MFPLKNLWGKTEISENSLAHGHHSHLVVAARLQQGIDLLRQPLGIGHRLHFQEPELEEVPERFDALENATTRLLVGERGSSLLLLQLNAHLAVALA